MTITKEKYPSFIKEKARELGFSFCGISRARFLEEEAPLMEKWLNKNMHGEMGYMENYFDKRLDPRKLFPGARSVVSLMFNYFPEKEQSPHSEYKVSKYAYGRDYHKVIRKKLKVFLQEIREEIGEIHGRGFVDSAPVLDKAWAKNSGIAWMGKNTNMINPKAGSFFFLAELILDLELEPDSPIKDYCGTCTKCIDACPTGAITDPYVVDGSRCISYLTIELRDKIPNSFRNTYDNWIFGCDICQDVCPWNRFSTTTHEKDFTPRKPVLDFEKKDWEELTETLFEEHFRGTPLMRTGFKGIKKNINFIRKNNDPE